MTMGTGAAWAIAPLFLPASKAAWLAKAKASGADALIVDLEDAVAALDKTVARDAVSQVDLSDTTTILRVNGLGTPWFEEDIALARRLSIDAVMLPKTEHAEEVAAVRDRLGAGIDVIALVETAKGIANLHAIAAVAGVVRLAFGSVDFCADLGCHETGEAVPYARSAMVIASRAAGIAPPLDGVTLALDDGQIAEADAARASASGFGGKMCIHPSQVALVRRGFAPAPQELAWARRLLAAATDGASRVDGVMVDPPVLQRARGVLRRADAMGLE
jgi:citrate lyase subunit beta / citryl-CoA lyase